MGNSSSKMRARKQYLANLFGEYWVDMPDLDARIKRFLSELPRKDVRLLTSCPSDLLGRALIVSDVSLAHPEVKIVLEVFQLIDWYAYLHVVAVVGPTDVMDTHFSDLPCNRTVEDVDGEGTTRKVIGRYSIKWHKNNSTTYVESKGNQEPVLRYMFRWGGGDGETVEGTTGTGEGHPLSVPDKLVFAGVLTPYGTEPFVFNEHTYVRSHTKFATVWKRVVTKPVKQGEECELVLS